MAWIVCDIETTGFEKEGGLICEVGMAVVEPNYLSSRETFARVIGGDAQAAYIDAMEFSVDKNERWVYDTHKGSGLLEACRRSTLTMADVQDDAIDWLHNTGVDERTGILLGSTIEFDKGWFEYKMPKLAKYLHHRTINVSSIKELARVWAPQMYERLPKKLETHRSVPDMDDTLRELRFYRSEGFIDRAAG